MKPRLLLFLKAITIPTLNPQVPSIHANSGYFHPHLPSSIVPIPIFAQFFLKTTLLAKINMIIAFNAKKFKSYSLTLSFIANITSTFHLRCLFTSKSSYFSEKNWIIYFFSHINSAMHNIIHDLSKMHSCKMIWVKKNIF